MRTGRLSGRLDLLVASPRCCLRCTTPPTPTPPHLPHVYPSTCGCTCTCARRVLRRRRRTCARACMPIHMCTYPVQAHGPSPIQAIRTCACPSTCARACADAWPLSHSSMCLYPVHRTRCRRMTPLPSKHLRVPCTRCRRMTPFKPPARPTSSPLPPIHLRHQATPTHLRPASTLPPTSPSPLPCAE